MTWKNGARFLTLTWAVFGRIFGRGRTGAGRNYGKSVRIADHAPMVLIPETVHLKFLLKNFFSFVQILENPRKF